MPPSSAPASPLPAFFVLIAALLAQAGTIQGGWVLESSTVALGGVEASQGIAGVTQAFGDQRLDTHQAHGAYRPLVLASFIVERSLAHGDDPLGNALITRLVHLLLHALAAWLLYGLLVRLIPARPQAALLASLLFAVHPLVPGTLAQALGREDLFAVILGVLFFRVLLRTREQGVVWLPLLGLTALLALFAKEAALAVLLTGAVYDMFARAPARGGRLLRLGVIGAAVLVFFLVWPGMPAGPIEHPPAGIGERLLLGSVGLVRLCLRYLLPVDLIADHGHEAIPGVGYEVTTAGLVAGIAALLLAMFCVLRLVRGRGGPLAAAWVATTACVLVGSAFAPAGAAFESRFAYLALLPFALVLGLGLSRLLGEGKPSPLPYAAGLATVAVALLMLGGLAFAQSRVWRDDEHVHAALFEAVPDHAPARIRWGANLITEAERLKREALGLRSVDQEGRANPERERLLEKRAANLRTADLTLSSVSRTPAGRGNPAVWYELARVQMARDRPADSIRSLEVAHQVFVDIAGVGPDGSLDHLSPRQREMLGSLWFLRGVCNEALGDRAAGARAYEEALQAEPAEPRYLVAAGFARCGERRWSEGIPLLERAYELMDDPAARRQLAEQIQIQKERSGEMGRRFLEDGRALLADGEHRLAIQAFEDAFVADPRLIEARIQAGWLLGHHMGQYQRGRQYLDQAESDLRGRPKSEARDKLLRDVEALRKRLEDSQAEAEAAERGG